MLKVAFDLDNTIVQTTRGLFTVLSSRLGLSADDLVETEDYRYPLRPREHTSEDTSWQNAYLNIWDEVMHLDLEPVQDAVIILNQLHQENLLVGYVTRRPSYQRKITEKWLAKHQFPKLTLIHAEHAPDQITCKSEGMQQLGANTLVDDHHSEIESVIKKGKRGLLIDTPFNRNLGSGLERVHSIQESYQKLHEWAKETEWEWQ